MSPSPGQMDAGLAYPGGWTGLFILARHRQEHWTKAGARGFHLSCWDSCNEVLGMPGQARAPSKASPSPALEQVALPANAWPCYQGHVWWKRGLSKAGPLHPQPPSLQSPLGPPEIPQGRPSARADPQQEQPWLRVTGCCKRCPSSGSPSPGASCWPQGHGENSSGRGPAEQGGCFLEGAERVKTSQGPSST